MGQLERGNCLPRLDTILKLSTGVGASPCSALAFTSGGTLYVRRDNAATLEVGAAAGFASLARDGSALFYAKEGALHRYDVKEEAATQIAASGALVNVAADGTRAYFASSEELAAGAEAGVDNLYLWEAEGDATSFVAVLDPADLEGNVNLARWAAGVTTDRAHHRRRSAVQGARPALRP